MGCNISFKVQHLFLHNDFLGLTLDLTLDTLRFFKGVFHCMNIVVIIFNGSSLESQISLGNPY